MRERKKIYYNMFLKSGKEFGNLCVIIIILIMNYYFFFQNVFKNSRAYMIPSKYLRPFKIFIKVSIITFMNFTGGK